MSIQASTPDTTKITLTKGLVETFNQEPGRKPIKEFGAEIKALTDNDRIELATLFAKERGMQVEVKLENGSIQVVG